MTTAEEKAEQLKKLKEAAEAAHAQARQELRRLSSAGVANPNFPAGMQRGAVNKTLNPPLFRTVRTSVGLHPIGPAVLAFLFATSSSAPSALQRVNGAVH